MVGGVVDHRVRAYAVVTGNTVQAFACAPLVQDAINRQDVQGLAREDHMRVIADGVAVAPKDRLWPQAEFFSDRKERIAALDEVGGQLRAAARRQNGVKVCRPGKGLRNVLPFVDRNFSGQVGV